MSSCSSERDFDTCGSPRRDVYRQGTPPALEVFHPGVREPPERGSYFLVSRRARVTPEHVGLPAGHNRRVPGQPPGQVSLAWLLSRPSVASVVVGVETVDELRANTTVADVELAPEHLDALTALAAGTPAYHHRAGDGPSRPSTTA